MGTGFKGLYGLLYVILEDIITKDYGHILIICKIFCQTQRLGDTACLVLDLVGEARAKVCA
jgi:hypothetical protein